jgi:diketogulonate reductase-like aldo/keto reductase
MHFPVSFIPGVKEALKESQVEQIAPAATWKEMEKLVDAGLCRNIGLSNHEIKDVKAI